MKINWLAILACVVLNAVLGLAWYGVFSQSWMDGNGLTMEVIENAENANMGYGISAAVALISAVIFTLFFRRMGVESWMDGLKSGAAVGLLALLGMTVNNWFSMEPMTLSLIDGGFSFFQYTLFGVIIGAWPNK